MKKTKYLLIAAIALAAMLLSACGGSTAPAAQQVAPPAAIDQPVVPAQSLAPACPAATSCAAPALTDTDVTNTYCVKKIPYQNISVPDGTTFEIQDPKGELKCTDSGTVVDGNKVLTCTGKQLWTYDLKLTNSSCNAANLATGTGQCQDGFGFDAAQNCCSPVNADSASTTIKVNIGACP